MPLSSFFRPALFKVLLENMGEVVLSKDKFSILKKIDKLGSIQKAAEEFGKSYRQAWEGFSKSKNDRG
jgi:molybdenum-dependent DNA-binding transcriptional regulator ModE